MYLENLINNQMEEFDVVNFYYANLALMKEIGKDLGVRVDEIDDFYQLCYVALQDALKAYNSSSSYPFIAFFRKCVKHRFFVYKLKMRYPVSLSYHSYLDYNSESIEFSLIETVSDCKEFELIELKIVSHDLWSIVEKLLSKKESFVIVQRYKHGRTLRDIARLFGCSYTYIWKIEQRSLKKLQKNNILKEIAFICYGIEGKEYY